MTGSCSDLPAAAAGGGSWLVQAEDYARALIAVQPRVTPDVASARLAAH
jgi:hypothetical protein